MSPITPTPIGTPPLIQTADRPHGQPDRAVQSRYTTEDIFGPPFGKDKHIDILFHELDHALADAYMAHGPGRGYGVWTKPPPVLPTIRNAVPALESTDMNDRQNY